MIFVSPEWEEIEKLIEKGDVVMALGGTDCGKTTFLYFLAQRLTERRLKVTLVDADPGQQSLGPPTVQSLGVWDKSERNFKILERFFVGSTSPCGHFLPCILG